MYIYIPTDTVEIMPNKILTKYTVPMECEKEKLYNKYNGFVIFNVLIFKLIILIYLYL